MHGIACDPHMDIYLDDDGIPSEKFAEQIGDAIKELPQIQANPLVGITIISVAKTMTIIEIEALVAERYEPLSELLMKSTICKEHIDTCAIDLVSIIAREWWADELDDMDEKKEEMEENGMELGKEQLQNKTTKPTNTISPYIREKTDDGQRTAFVLGYKGLDNIITTAKLAPNLKNANINLYKLKGKYYVLVDNVIGESDDIKKEVFDMQRFVDTGRECGGQFKSPRIITFIKEHGECFPEETFQNLKIL